MSEFDGITGLDGWSKKLEELIAEARQSADLNVAARVALNDRFADFIINSRPNTPEILELDGIAERTSDAMMEATLDERLASLSLRRTELARLTKKFEAETEASAAAAKSITLENITSVVDSLTETTQALQKLKNSVKDSSDADLQSSIESTVRSVERLINKFKKKKDEVEGST